MRQPWLRKTNMEDYHCSRPAQWRLRLCPKHNRLPLPDCRILKQ